MTVNREKVIGITMNRHQPEAISLALGDVNHSQGGVPVGLHAIPSDGNGQVTGTGQLRY